MKLRATSLILFDLIIASHLATWQTVAGVVVYQVRSIASKNGRTDYALAGESIELSCHYLMKDEAEDIKQLVWSKDGKNFLRWRKNKPGLEVLSYLFKGHIDPSSKHSHLSIHNVSIEMHGKYKCYVKTDLGSHEMEQELTVISQSHCKIDDWRLASQPSRCEETFRLDCRNMFPKPVPSCGLWNSRLDKFIQSVAVDISEEQVQGNSNNNKQQTYRVRYSDKFQLPPVGSSSELLAYAGHLIFKCDIIVPETSWKLSLSHKMFDYEDGCNQDPLDTIERMRYNYSQYATARMQQAGITLHHHRQPDDLEMLTSSLKYELLPPASSKPETKLELNCWQRPRHGTLARLSCASQTAHVRLVGASLLECQSSGWVLVAESHLKRSNSSKKWTKSRRPARPSRRAGLAATGTEVEMSTEPGELLLSRAQSNDLEEQATTSLPSTEVELIPTTTNTPEILKIESQSFLRHPASLSHGQLASLLPTCVSTIQRQAPSNRLPLLDDKQAPVLESRPQLKSFIFSFSSSSAAATTGTSDHWAWHQSVRLLSLSMLLTYLLFASPP